jgi:hypothetical protein
LGIGKSLNHEIKRIQKGPKSCFKNGPKLYDNKIKKISLVLGGVGVGHQILETKVAFSIGPRILRYGGQTGS